MVNSTLSGIRDYDDGIELHNYLMENIPDSIKLLLDSENIMEDTLVLESEILEDKCTEATSNIIQKEKTNRIRSLNDSISHKIVSIDSYYDSVEEFYGVVESIDRINNTFEALLRPANDKASEKNIKATFDIDDIQESDKILLSVGVQLVWLIGKERKINNIKGVLKPGGITNISRLQLRRTRVLNKKQKMKIEEMANEWSQFFTRLDGND